MKIAIVGCGSIARTHARILKKNISGADLLFCDRNRDKADAYRSQYSSASSAYTDLNELLEREAPSAVHILTQPGSHVALATAALNADAHVYIEKPVTQSLAELDVLYSLAESRQRILCSGYNTIAYPVLQRAKAMIASGEMGGLISLHSDFNVGPAVGKIPYGKEDHWAYFLSGGILENVIDHPMSLLADALEDPVLHDVCVLRRARLPEDSPNLMHATVHNAGQIGTFTLSYGNGNAFAYVTYFLEAGTIRVDLRNFTLVAEHGAGPRSFQRRFLTGLKTSAGLGLGMLGMVAARLRGRMAVNPGIDSLVRNFYATITHDEEALVSRQTSRNTVRLLEGIWAQAAREKPASPAIV